MATLDIDCSGSFSSEKQYALSRWRSWYSRSFVMRTRSLAPEDSSTDRSRASCIIFCKVCRLLKCLTCSMTFMIARRYYWMLNNVFSVLRENIVSCSAFYFFYSAVNSAPSLENLGASQRTNAPSWVTFFCSCPASTPASRPSDNASGIPILSHAKAHLTQSMKIQSRPVFKLCFSNSSGSFNESHGLFFVWILSRRRQIIPIISD